MRNFSCVRRSEPGGAFALTGRTSSQRPKTRKKMIRLSSQSVTRARAKRLSRNRPIGTPSSGGDARLPAQWLADEPRLSQVQVSHGARLDARNVLSRGRQEVVEVGEDDRRLVE